MTDSTHVVTDVPATEKAKRFTRTQLKNGAKYTAYAVVGVLALDNVRKRVRRTEAGNILIDPSVD